ncbi:hypothetical protein BV25DRAFT_1557022 [Artomyces pyxidatus]|uniref:Uncharacterized protein n=1 Tax=Artomyces pyxidatus TaxID=48021 RepID=A0ACB8SJL5_9AGAM|nr:hypothetical protein BV25DRAFT_1557022 [Artomyces pyxidatus]
MGSVIRSDCARRHSRTISIRVHEYPALSLTPMCSFTFSRAMFDQTRPCIFLGFSLAVVSAVCTVFSSRWAHAGSGTPGEANALLSASPATSAPMAGTNSISPDSTDILDFSRDVIATP